MANLNKIDWSKYSVYGMAQYFSRTNSIPLDESAVHYSMEELEKRLRNRGTENEECICERLKIAKEEMKRADEYDFIVINDTLEDAVEEVLSIVKKSLIK